MRFTSDGTTVRAQRSADGSALDEHGQRRPTSTGSPTRRSACTRTASTAAGTPGRTRRAFDYFTLDAPQDPSDEFDGTSLNLCRWSQIVRHEPGGYTVGGGNLTLPAAHGDFFANAPNNNPNILLQPAPAGPWTMTTRLTFDPNENYEQAGLLVYGDDANYVKADYVYANGRGLEFLREANNVAAGFGGFVNISTPADDGRDADHLGRDDAARRTTGSTAGAWTLVRRAGRAGRACRTRRSASTPTTATRR